MNTLFKTNIERKIRICDKSMHKTMQITVEIHQTNKNSLLQFNQKMNINWDSKIIYGYNLLTKTV